MRPFTKSVSALGLGLMGLLALQGVGAADPSQPFARPVITPPRWEMMQVGVEIFQDGRPMRTIQHEGKTYLPVPRLGTEYQIRVSSHGPRRVVAIVSVDGLSVINGRPASENNPGYIVGPRGHILIEGWRRNMQQVAAFSFEERDRSYATLVGHPENVGVIGLIAFEELSRLDRFPAEGDFARPALREQSSVGGTGTGYGREIDSAIYYVPFLRSANRRTVTIYYDTFDNLRRMGVPVDRTFPSPFPVDPGFVPPPPIG